MHPTCATLDLSVATCICMHAESMFCLHGDHTRAVLCGSCVMLELPHQLPYSIIHRLVATQFSQNYASHCTSTALILHCLVSTMHVHALAITLHII